MSIFPNFQEIYRNVGKPLWKTTTFCKPRKGWICPKCGKVYAPFVPECVDCNKKEKENVSGTHTK